MFGVTANCTCNRASQSLLGNERAKLSTVPDASRNPRWQRQGGWEVFEASSDWSVSSSSLFWPRSRPLLVTHSATASANCEFKWLVAFRCSSTNCLAESLTTSSTAWRMIFSAAL